MRTETKEYTVYDYNDLLANKELKERVLEKHWDINVSHEWWDWVYQYWFEKLAKLGIENPEFEWELYSQGAGASIDCNDIDINELIDSDLFKSFKENDLNDKELKTLKVLYDKGIIYNFDCRGNYYNKLDPSKHRKQSDIVHKFDWILRKFIEDLCDDFYHDLKEEYDYLTSEEGILETLQINEYEFLEDGTIA